MVAVPERTRAPIYEGTRIPYPIPTVLRVPDEIAGTGDVLPINFGPNHPSTHGVLRLIVDLYGEDVVGLEAVVGYLHTGFEKNMEQKSWWKAITYPERIDYLSFQANELVFVLAIEKLLELEVPEKAQWMRTCLCELNRIHSHLVWLGTAALELGAISMFWYCFREREQILDLFEMVCGTRMHTRYFQAGGLAEDIPRGFFPEARRFATWMPKAVDEYEALVDKNMIWLERTVGLGLLSAEDAIALGQSGPVLRASGVDWDLRRVEPYLTYAECDFDVPVYHEGDVYARYRVHMEEMRESVKIIAQCLDRLEAMEGEPWIADDRKVVLPPREELHTSMESLIHHFKIVTEGYRVPEGEVYVTRRVAPRRARLLRRLRRRPEAVAGEVPRAVVRRPRGDGDLHDRRARRGHDRDRRLPRHRHGRGRPVMETLFERIQEERERFPEGSRSATIPALRLAQEQYGWLPPEAIREVADALGLTPAYCHAVASFYDMFHLEPVGEHLIEVCTNLSCALVGAQRVVDAFESELRLDAGETTDDGKITFRTVECLGGCGYATVVAVDSRYRQHVKPVDVPGNREGDPWALVACSSPARTTAT